jgi:glycosyltransferase involved in cell wall biosynthesis
LKIGFVTTTYPRYEGDSAGVFLANQVESLRKLGHDVKVIAPECDGDTCGELQAGVIRVKFRPRAARKITYGSGIWPNLRKNPLLFFAMPGFLKSFERTIQREFGDRDIIEALFTAAGKALIKARRPGQAIVYAGHGSDIHLLESSAYYRRYFYNMIRKYDAVIVVSRHLASNVTSHFADISPIEVPNAVPDEAFKYERPWRDEPAAIYASRLIALKRIDMLVTGWASVVSHFPTAKLIVFGDGPLLQKCKSICRDKRIENNVEFRGLVSQKELWEEIAQGWLTVLPSMKEGFGMPLVESLACGCPFLSAPCGAAPEIAKETGGGIIIDEPLTPEKIAKSIIEIFKNKESLEKMKKNGRNEVLMIYSSREIALKKIGIYEMALNNLNHYHEND